MKILRQLNLFLILTLQINSQDSFDLQFENQKIRVLSIEKNKLKKPETYNPFYSKDRIFDSRFRNGNFKSKGIDIVKKKLVIEKNSTIEFEINSKLNHHLEVSELNHESNFKNTIGKNKFKLFLNNKEVTEKLFSNLEKNIFKIETGSEKVEFEKIKLISESSYEDKKMDILFIVIDSLRADVVGFNSAKFQVTPQLDLFAKTASNYQNNFVNSSWTRPSTFIFFTGIYASKTFLNFWDYSVFPNEVQSFYKSKIPILPETLSRLGYDTVMIGNNPFLTEHRGIGADVGFHSVYDFSNFEIDTLRISEQAKNFYQGIKPIEKRSPYFLFLNFNDPHKPYTPPKKFLSQVKQGEGMDSRKKDYLGEVAFVDEEIGKIISLLKDKKLFDSTLILITSDHGEVMNPKHAKSVFNGVYTLYGHGQGLYDEDVHTPLLIKFPNQKKSKVYTKQTRSIDLMPTILETINKTELVQFDGISLLKLDSESKERIYYGESRGVIGIRSGGFKYLQKVFGFHRVGAHWSGIVGQEPSWLYDLNADREENYPIENAKKTNQFSEMAHSFWKKNSIFKVRISNPSSEEKNFEFETYMNSGKSLVCDESGKPNLDKQFVNTSKGFQVKRKMAPKETFTFSFLPYPEIDFPKFKISVNGKKIPKENFGVGEKDLDPSFCRSNEECSKVYLANHRKPEIPKKFRIQIWLETKSIQLKKENTSLEKDAIEILRKQGYIQ